MLMTLVILVLCTALPVLGVAHIAESRRRGRAEREALESERRFRQLAESSFDMNVRFEPRTQQRSYISPAVRRLYGYEPDEAMKLSADEIIHPEDLPNVREALHRLEHADHEPITYRGRRKDGSYIWVEASLTRSTNPETGTPEVVSVVRDVSEHVRYEAALRQAKEQADAASRAKSEFLGTMSHELRTPLNAIIGFNEIMKEGVMGPLDNPHYRSYIADIHFSSTHLLNLINEILDVTKAEAGKLEVQEQVFDLRDVIEAVVRISGPPIDKAGVTVGIDLPPDLPRLQADEGKTRQVFFNLVSNAVKFTPAGGRIDISGRFDRARGLTGRAGLLLLPVVFHDASHARRPFARLHDVEIAPRVAPDAVARAVDRPVAPARQPLAIQIQDADKAAIVLGDVDRVLGIDIEECRADQFGRPDFEQLSVLIEHLHAVVLAVGDKQAAAPVDPDAVRQIELPRRVAGLAPGELVFGLGREFVDPGVAVTVGHKHLARGRESDVGRQVERAAAMRHLAPGLRAEIVLRHAGIGALAFLADRLQQFAVGGEFIELLVMLVA